LKANGYSGFLGSLCADFRRKTWLRHLSLRGQSPKQSRSSKSGARFGIAVAAKAAAQ
jgi:hypothetical protein